MSMDFKQQDKQYIVGSYGRFDVVLKKGKNATCWDVDGKEYIDFTSGIGVNSLGYADEGWADAVARQAGCLQHASNLYYTTPAVELAKALCGQTGCDKVFFVNSGAEANECAIKAARKYSFDKYGKERTEIVTLQNSFHGRTVTTLAATGQDVFHNFFFPFTEGFSYAKPNDLENLKATITENTCAVMMELIQGEGGVLPLNSEFVRQAAAYCKERDILLIVDEVQTGVGRTGTFLASEHYGITPDLTTLAKGLGGGLPIGAVLFGKNVSGVLGPGQHGTTFGGNPVACAAGCEVLRRVCQPGFLDEVAKKGVYLREKLTQIPEVEGVDGEGMMLGVRLKTKTSADAAKACVQNGLLILTAKHKLRLLPPLTITMEEIDKGLAILANVLAG